ncbi:hypothetical protein [Phytohabitans rumicis]|uniref:ESX-1 secretion-associated protein n=1 Tax=Phytohabitans rumicis TaxID=1076125 RepID=A0A6V8L5I8_9ACTN|nr:hypothetical protein [Phytohabitans rumicis]GFJ90850.1 hypothetical protein Prum_044920 [Phytohabitans rumicis]
MASVEEVKAHVAASVDQTQRAMTALRGVTDQLDEALARLRLTAVGAMHPSVLDAISRLEQAKSRLDEAHTLARGAIDSADRYRSIV